MTDTRRTPAVFSIAPARPFSDTLAQGIVAERGGDVLALARGIILLPNNRAVRAVRDAFVRASGGGMLMPRLVPIGDIDLGERLGSTLDPIGGELDIPPAIAPIERQMILARLVQQARLAEGRRIDAGEAMRLAQALGQTIDQMMVERVRPAALRDLKVSDELQAHWQASLRTLEVLLDRWPEELAKRGMIDLAERRNRLLDHVARRWAVDPPNGFVVAAGISTSAPAVCAVLRTVSRMPAGQVVLAGLDRHMSAEEWDAIGPFEPDPDTGFTPRAQETHPQFALKLMLDRIGVARDEVRPWPIAALEAESPRERAISDAMQVPDHTAKWRDRTGGDGLDGVSLIEAATPAEEAQAIALVLRETVETPGRTAALVTPDRTLATRVAAHLRRWGIEADDSAGRPLSLTPPGTLVRAMARVAAERFAPVPLLDMLKHPLVRQGDERLAWLDAVRRLDLLLRGPRPAPCLAGLAARLRPRDANEEDRQARLRAEVESWWRAQSPAFAPLDALSQAGATFAQALAVLRELGSVLTGDRLWAGHQRRALAELFAELEMAAGEGPGEFDIDALPDMLDTLLEGQAVRPPQGGHPRIAIYGLIETRLQQHDVTVLGGLNEGTWPGLPAPDPWLAPRIRAELGLPGLDRRIGLSAHDFASALASPRVFVTRSRRSENAPAIASRLWLRLQAMAGDRLDHAVRYVRWAAAIDDPGRHDPADRPAPNPPAELRPKVLPVTALDRLAADPFGFYANRILRLPSLDRIDADPGPAWRGTQVHRVLELWFREDACAPGRLEERARELLSSDDAHPVLRAFWQPRLLAALGWIEGEIAQDRAGGRRIAHVEIDGATEIAGVKVTGKADRIDQLPDGTIAVIDYKTGKAPGARQVGAGFALQLGLLGAIAEKGGFPALGRAARVSAFEYWSLAKDKDGFGKRSSPVTADGKRNSILTAEFTEHAVAHFTRAAEKWLTGTAPFVADINPDLPHYTDYDQLMRLEEWYGRENGGVAGDA